VIPSPGLFALWRRIVAIGGEPATGKTTVVRKVIDEFSRDSTFHRFEYGLLRGHCVPNKRVVILGIYASSETFAGTDRLSLQVTKDAISFLSRSKELGLKDYAIVFEGDRLFGTPFLSQCRMVAPTDILIVKASSQTLKRRHIERADDQTAEWCRSRAVKLDNIQKVFKEAELLENESREDMAKIVKTILARLYVD